MENHFHFKAENGVIKVRPVGLNRGGTRRVKVCADFFTVLFRFDYFYLFLNIFIFFGCMLIGLIFFFICLK